MDKEFEDICMKKRVREIEPSAFEITNPIEMDKLAKSHNPGQLFFSWRQEHYKQRSAASCYSARLFCNGAKGL